MGKLSIILLIALIGCGPICEKETEYLAAFNEFFRLTGAAPTNVCSIRTGKLERPRIGQAQITEYWSCNIYIVPGLLPYTLRATVYHEIAHCLGFDHVSKRDHILHATSLSEQAYRTNWSQLEQEFITYVKENN